MGTGMEPNGCMGMGTGTEQNGCIGTGTGTGADTGASMKPWVCVWVGVIIWDPRKPTGTGPELFRI